MSMLGIAAFGTGMIGFGSGMIARRMVPGLGVGVGIGAFSITANKAMSAMEQGTAVTNPVFYSNASKAYGKRGIDANNLNTGNLVQNLHKNRRKF